MNPEIDKKIKHSLRANQGPELPMDDAFFEKLHDRVMASVEKTEIAPLSPMHRQRRLLKTNWKSWLISGGSLMMIFVASFHAPPMVRSFLDQSHGVQVFRNEDNFVAETLRSPEAFSETLISYQSESDFFVDVAERSFHDLSQEHVREIMGEAGP